MLNKAYGFNIDFDLYPLDSDIKIYKTPRIGIFRIEDNTKPYSLPEGWPQKLEKFKIIAESKICYIYDFIATTSGINGEGEKYSLEIGVNKTRLHQWLDDQLLLF